VDLQSDVQNCGACGIRCPEGQKCVEGKCLPPPTCPKEFPFYDPVRNVCLKCRDQSDCGPNEQCCSGDCVPVDAVCCGTIICPGPFRFCVDPKLPLCCTDPSDPKGFVCTSLGIKPTALKRPERNVD